jgi:hypothetical protein
MRETTVTIAFALALAAWAQTSTPTGSIDGTAIPSKVLARYTRQNAIDDLRIAQGIDNPTETQIAQRVDQYGICRSLRSHVQYAAREVKELGVTVTPQEVAAQRATALAQMRTVSGNPAAMQQIQDMRDLIPLALAEVYQQGKDPQQVYANELASPEISQKMWQTFLRTPNAKTAEGRAKIKQQYQTSYR